MAARMAAQRGRGWDRNREDWTFAWMRYSMVWLPPKIISLDCNPLPSLLSPINKSFLAGWRYGGHYPGQQVDSLARGEAIPQLGRVQHTSPNHPLFLFNSNGLFLRLSFLFSLLRFMPPTHQLGWTNIIRFFTTSLKIRFNHISKEITRMWHVAACPTSRQLWTTKVRLSRPSLPPEWSGKPQQVRMI